MSLSATFAKLSSFFLTYSSFSTQHIDISYEAVFSALATFKLALFTLDYVYRGVQTGLLVARYWDQSIVPLPAVDIRNDYDKHQGVSITYTRRLLVTTLYHTWSYTGFVIVLLIVAVYCIAGSYSH